MPSSTNDGNALHTQNLTKLDKCHPLASSGLLCCSASHSSGEKNLASRFIDGGNRSGSVSGLLCCSASYSSGEKNLASRFIAGGDSSGSVSANHDVCDVLCVL